MPRILSKYPTKKEIERIADAVSKGDGLVSTTAEQLHVSREVFYGWMKKYPAIVDALGKAKELRLDVAESKLQIAIENGEAWAICFYLKCQGKSRGYVERQEVTGADGKPIEHAIKELPEAALRAIAQGSNRGAGKTPAD